METTRTSGWQARLQGRDPTGRPGLQGNSQGLSFGRQGLLALPLELIGG
jgi:hypothetical protein